MNKKTVFLMGVYFLSVIPIELSAMPRDAFSADSGEERGSRRRSVRSDQFKNDSGDENNHRPSFPLTPEREHHHTIPVPPSTPDMSATYPREESRDYTPAFSRPSRPRPIRPERVPVFVPVETVREVPVYIHRQPHCYHARPMKFKHFLGVAFVISALTWLLSSDDDDVRY